MYHLHRLHRFRLRLRQKSLGLVVDLVPSVAVAVDWVPSVLLQLNMTLKTPSFVDSDFLEALALCIL